VHYINPDEVQSPAVLDPNRPEGIIYEGHRVIGAVFIMPRVEDTGPRIAGCLTGWHRHVDADGQPTPEAMHVWIVDRPGGPFSD
jgi:hypothetical protein